MLYCYGADDGGSSHFPFYLEPPVCFLSPFLFFGRDQLTDQGQERAHHLPTENIMFKNVTVADGRLSG
jgi:hypothetical protein